MNAKILNAKILIVEDESTLADMLEFNLSSEGYSVSVATDGEMAFEKWRLEKPDLVLLDVMLPKDRKSTRLNSSHVSQSRMPSSA